jgi:glycosyltransferase involved in cell wall biosynthesis
LALANLLRDGYSARLIRIGGLPTETQSRLIRSRNLDDHITHISYLPNSELPAYYNAADVFVFPSLYEGFGVPVIEAMACGTPVICSNAASLPEVVRDAGLLIDPQSSQALSEAIAQVLTDRPLAQELRQRGLDRARRFTWQRTAEQTLQVYQRLLDQ